MPRLAAFLKGVELDKTDLFEWGNENDRINVKLMA